MTLDPLTRAAIRWRWAVIGVWLGLTVAGLSAASQLSPLLSTSLEVPGSGSHAADDILSQHFINNPDGTFTVVFRSGFGSPQARKAVSSWLRRAAQTVPESRVTAVRVQAGIAHGSIDTRLDLQKAQAFTDRVRQVLSGRRGPRAYVTGIPALQHDLDDVLAGDLLRGELIALSLAVIILVSLLGLRWTSLVPLVMAPCAIATTMLLLFALAHMVLMVSYVPNLVELLGLALAIDYSLLVVQRFREELVSGPSTGTQQALDPELSRTRVVVDAAIVRTMATAGRSVLFSGIAVALAFAVVLVVPVPFLQSLGMAGLGIPLVSVVAALTLQPALLSVLEGFQPTGTIQDATSRPTRRLDVLVRARARVHAGSDRFWSAVGNVTVQRRAVVLLASCALLALATVPIGWLDLTPGTISAIPGSMPSAKGLRVLAGHLGDGAVTPIEVVVDARSPMRARSRPVSAAVLRLADRTLEDPQVFVVAIGTGPPYVDPTGRYRRLEVISRGDFGAPATQNLVERLRSHLIPAAHFPAGVHVFTGGIPAQGFDFMARLYAYLPWLAALVAIVTFLILSVTFLAPLLALANVALDAALVAATNGLVVLVFRSGLGSRFLGIHQVPRLEGWVPVLLFAALCGLSMDYQVFLGSRMREAYHAGSESADAIRWGLARTGPVITGAALIMVVSFSGFVFGRIVGVQELGAGLIIGVVLDATIMRMLLMPSLMAAMGDWCWWPRLPLVPARWTR